MAKEKPKTQETEEQIAIRKEIRKEWGSMEPKLIEMAHKSEDNGLIENSDYIWLKGRISNLSKHFDKQ
jgi:inactivated superfamily I helicase